MLTVEVPGTAVREDAALNFSREAGSSDFFFGIVQLLIHSNLKEAATRLLCFLPYLMPGSW